VNPITAIGVIRDHDSVRFPAFAPAPKEQAMSHPYDLGDKKKASKLGPTLKFKGELTANEDLVIQGQVEGSIKHSSNLTIGEAGKLKANVEADHVAIEGEVRGDIVGGTSVVVMEGANVDGNIYSPTVTLREGATFNGKIDMSGKAGADKESTPKPKKHEQEPVAKSGEQANDDSAAARTAGAA
jgi:cytoskeletal protein CcmA (bactofilin family)